jgi:hypothetical protein
LPNPKFKNIYKYKFNVQVIEFTRQEPIDRAGSAPSPAEKKINTKPMTV